jgi:hypothetical protein
VKISTNFWKPNLLNPLCDNGYGIIVRFSENRYIFLKKLKTGTIFWKKLKTSTIFWRVRFSGRTKYDFLEKVHFSGKYDFLEKVQFSGTPQKAGAQVRIYVCAPFGND